MATTVECSSLPSPDTSNICNISVGSNAPDMPNFCAAVVGRDDRRNQYCAAISSGNEWVWQPGNYGGSCYSNSCDCWNFQRLATSDTFCLASCDIGICSAYDMDSAGLPCTRVKFTGDPVGCCFNDLACGGSCWSDTPNNPNQPGQNTCADGQNGQPNYRDIKSNDCRDTLLQYCTGTLTTDTYASDDWLNRWTTGGNRSCLYALQRNISLNTCVPPITPVQCDAPLLNIDADGFFWAQQVISGVLQHYTDNGFIIGALPGTNGWNPFQDFLYTEVCCPYAGLCQDSLALLCSTYNSQRISFNPTLTQWCGCHLPIGEYQAYSTNYNIPPECTPMCNHISNIPITGINGTPVTCQQNICLIDQVNINLINSQIGNGIDFTQVCGNCGGGECSCIVTNTTIDIENSTIGGNFIPINQGCGTFTCTQTNSGLTGPAIINIACSSMTGSTGSTNPYQQYQDEVTMAQQQAKKISMFWTIVVVSVALILVFFMIFYMYPRD